MHITRKIVLVVFFVMLLAAVIAYARGYRLDTQKGTVTSTGIIAVSSNPGTAKVYVNGVLKGVTDMHLTLPFGKYTVEVRKEGYTTWKRNYVLKGELVVTADATLFPLNASLTPLTTIGISSVVTIDKTDKALLFVQNGDTEKDGIYLFDQTKRPFSLFPPLKILAYKNQFPSGVDMSGATVTFSPDYKEGVFTFKNGEDSISYLLSVEEENKQLFEVTSSKDSLFSVWDEERQKETLKLLEIFPSGFMKIASDSFKILSLSPDKTKILYESKQGIDLPLIIDPPLVSVNQTPEERSLKLGQLYVYDRKEDRNYKITLPFDVEANRVKGDNVIIWFPSSRHLIVHEENKISIMEYDGTNKQIVYSGPHDGSYFDVTSDNKLLILANLNPQLNKVPDLYAVGIR